MQGRFTRRQLAAVLCFGLVFCLLFLTADRLFFDKTIYCTTWNRIRDDRDVPDILILGNSHAYCSFVPDLINGALGVDSAVLAVTGQDALGITDNFEAVLKVGKPKLVIAEVNAFFFTPGIMAQGNKGAALSNLNGMPGLGNRALLTAREMGLENVPQGSFQLLRADLMWSRWEALFDPPVVNRYEQPDILGYGRLDYFATGDYTSADVAVVTDPAADTGEQVDAASQSELRRFLAMAQANDVEVWLVKSPIASRGVIHPNGTDTARTVAADYGDTVTFCYDYNDDLPALDFTVGDFYDGGHLNRRGAAKFTQWFIRDMAQRLHLSIDTNNAFAYLDESVVPLSGGEYRYTLNASGKNLLYRFDVINPEGYVTLSRDWSESNTLDCAVAPQMADWVQVTVCPAELFDQRDKAAMTLRFMVANTCVLSR